LRGSCRRASANTREIAQLKFRPPASSFGARAAAVIEIAALQHGWRDFRIAQINCERGDAALPKNWTAAPSLRPKYSDWRVS
jgi:hypothetical protein